MDKLMDALLGMGTAGPLVGLLFWLWWQERTERRELMAKVMELAVASKEAAKDATAAINALAAKVGA
jgi:hypothetical protein